MKYFFGIIFCLITLTNFAQSHQIDLEFPHYANQKIYLGFYYGNLKGLQDSIVLDQQGKGSIKGNQPLSKGIYFIVSPNREIMFEVLIPEKQHFSIYSNSTNFPYVVKFNGSEENQRFNQFSHQANYLGQAINRLANSKDPSPLVKDSIENYKKRLLDARKAVIQYDANSMISLFFKAMEEPDVPTAQQQPGGKFDTAYVRKYLKDNYWGPIDFTDPMYIRTPFFENKLNTYFDHLIAPIPDSIIKEVDYMMAFAGVNDEMYRFMLTYFINKYIQPQYMGQDAVFVHVFEKFIASGKADFLPAENRTFIENRAYSMMANLIGKKAAELELIDLEGNKLQLYNIDAPLTVLCFWDPSCSHCKEVLPKIDSLYQNDWKQKGIKILAVNIGNDLKLWKEFVQKYKLQSWLHGYRDEKEEQALIAQEKAGYKQLYDITQTPLLYLLDNDKRILAKKLTYQQLNDLVKFKKQ